MDFGIARSAAQPAAAAAGHGARRRHSLRRVEARRSAAATVAGAVIGTIEYMAPGAGEGPARRSARRHLRVRPDLLRHAARAAPAEHAASAIDELQARLEQPLPLGADRGARRFPKRSPPWSPRCIEPDAANAIRRPPISWLRSTASTARKAVCPIMRRLTRRTMAAAAVLVLVLLGGTYYTTKWVFAPPTTARSRLGRDRGLSEQHQRPAFDNTLGQIDAPRARRRELHQRLRSQQNPIDAGRAAARQAGRGRRARDRGQAGARRRDRRIDCAERQRLRDHGQGGADRHRQRDRQCQRRGVEQGSGARRPPLD